MYNITELFRNTAGLSPELQTRLLASIIIILILYSLRALIMRVVWQQTEDVRTRYVWRKTSSHITVAIGIILLGGVWLRGFQSMATFFGLVAAGLAIALKDPVTNIVGWFFIMVRQPLAVGDRIQIGDHAGDVIDTRLFQFSLLEIGNWVDADQSTGRVIHIPNEKIFTEILANYSQGFQYIWNEVPVLITFESNWKRAKEILQKIANKHAEHRSELAQKRIKEESRRFMIFYSQLTPIVYTSVRDSGVLLTMRYLCEPRRRRGSEEVIWEEILEEFGRCGDIDLAYPTQRFFDNRKEGKPETKPFTDNKET